MQNTDYAQCNCISDTLPAHPKIGIFTPYNKHNYGSVLQALSLQRAISALFPDAYVEHLNYYWRLCSYRSHLLYEPTAITPLRYRQARAVHLDEIDERQRLFEAFINRHLSFSKTVMDYAAIWRNRPQYDIYVSGGDCLWDTVRYSLQSRLPAFFAFTNSPNKIAYGCGMHALSGNAPYPLEFSALPLLQQYKKIMVRENLGAEVLRRYLNQRVEVVLDTALLLCAEDYRPFMSKPPIDVDFPFILAYFLNDTDNETLTYALNQISEANKKKVLLLTADIPINTENITTLTAIGPAQWLWLYANADSVITNSFHGTAFSVIFNRPFLSVGMDERKRTLLDTLDLTTHIIDTLDELPEKHAALQVDYSPVNDILEKERARCKGLLKEAIEMCR